MKRSLLVLRHAKSDWNTDAATDFDRPLAGRGERDAPRMASWMLDQGLVPQRIISSPAARAKQTTLAICKVLAIGEKAVVWDERVYEASRADLLNILAECPDTLNMPLLVGHNPGLESLLVYLCGGDVCAPADGKLLPTATLAHLEITVPWSELKTGVARLLSITRPRSLEQG